MSEKKYDLLSATSASELVNKVNDALASGRKLLGQPFLQNGNVGNEFFQTIVDKRIEPGQCSLCCSSSVDNLAGAGQAGKEIVKAETIQQIKEFLFLNNEIKIIDQGDISSDEFYEFMSAKLFEEKPEKAVAYSFNIKISAFMIEAGVSIYPTEKGKYIYAYGFNCLGNNNYSSFILYISDDGVEVGFIFVNAIKGSYKIDGDDVVYALDTKLEVNDLIIDSKDKLDFKIITNRWNNKEAILFEGATDEAGKNATVEIAVLVDDQMTPAFFIDPNSKTIGAYSPFNILVNQATLTEEGTVKKTAAQADSKATNIAELVADFNAYLAKQRQSEQMLK